MTGFFAHLLPHTPQLKPPVYFFLESSFGHWANSVLSLRCARACFVRLLVHAIARTFRSAYYARIALKGPALNRMLPACGDGMAASISGMIKNPHQATKCLLGLPQHDMVWLAGRVAAATTSQQDACCAQPYEPPTPPARAPQSQQREW
jgi:hypothetical protein